MANDVRTATYGLTVEELSRAVGMSPRNIRAHQARRLLAPPVRKGRTVLYDESHVQRLRTILELQRQGFNLVSIEAMLGARDPDPATPGVAPMVNRMAVEHPQCVNALTRHRVLARTDDGALHPARSRVIRAALALHGVGLAPPETLQVLGELLDRLTPVTEELIQTSSERILSMIPPATTDGSFEDLDRRTAALTDAIVQVMSEAFRVAIENCSETIVATSVNRRHGLNFEMDLDPSQFMDNG